MVWWLLGLAPGCGIRTAVPPPVRWVVTPPKVTAHARRSGTRFQRSCRRRVHVDGADGSGRVGGVLLHLTAMVRRNSDLSAAIEQSGVRLHGRPDRLTGTYHADTTWGTSDPTLAHMRRRPQASWKATGQSNRAFPVMAEVSSATRCIEGGCHCGDGGCGDHCFRGGHGGGGGDCSDDGEDGGGPQGPLQHGETPIQDV
jgi:hypothetical protein